MSDWREKLREVLRAKGYDMKAASLGAGLNAAAVQQIVKGNDPQASTLIKLAERLELSLDQILLGRGTDAARPAPTTEVRLAPVVGTVAAGLWYSIDTPPQVESEPVPYVPCRYPELEQTAYKVVGPSMNLRRIEDGDFVIAVPYWEARVAPVDNDIAVVERSRDGGLVETTVKEIVVTRTEIKLIPRSDDPAFQEETVIPRRAGPMDFSEVRIVGLVVGRFSPV